MVLLCASCRDKVSDRDKDINIEAFSDLRTPVFSLDSKEIRRIVDSLCYGEKSYFAGDRLAKNHYLGGGEYLWIDRYGVDSRADSLLAVLADVGDVGFSKDAFFVDVIASDLVRMRNLDFDESSNTVNHVLGRLEYFLTKACFRYCVGMRFGFVNPDYEFNRLDTLDSSSGVKRFRKLFDIDIQHQDKAYLEHMLECISSGQIRELTSGLEPQDSLYVELKSKLKHASGDFRRQILCNMERCRWRIPDKDAHDGRLVVVNIPAFHLYAYGGDSVLDMRIGCGSRKTKTPLLVSRIERMDVNPVWNIPYSIIKADIVHRATDTAYFNRNRYYVVDRETGERVAQSNVTSDMLRSGNYRVVQEGGEGNSLGRIIFRFPNNFSVFLHDTSSKRVFASSVRSVSHGCVRVQKPFELAEFLLNGADEWTLDKLRISMGLQPMTERGLELVARNGDKELSLVKSLRVSPSVPLHIIYYTLYYDESGRLCTYRDIYGYDSVIYNNIKRLVG